MPTAQQTIDWYDENAELYAGHLKDAATSPYHAYYEKPAMYSLLPELHGKTVISLGCGSGEDSSYLKKQGAVRSVGIDVSKGLIEIAKRDHPECEFIIGSMEKLPFKDDEFDLVYSSFALHYLSTYENALKEAYRVLKKDGIILFSVGHPLGASMEVFSDGDVVKERKLGISKDLKTKVKRVYGNYLSNKSLRTHIADFDVTLWKQPISSTINQLVSTGFVIDKCLEPLPLKEMEDVDPENYKVLLRIPDIIIFRAKKLNH